MPPDPSRAVFLSYASQDAEAARRICDTLRASGVEVWFDADGGLEHGDEWDTKIRRQIKECVLFIAVISANTQARHEGYFRIEWDLAAERARGIASGVPFILPVVIDDTREPDALVPDRFRAVQWTKLRAGEVPPEVQQRFLKLWSHRTGVLKHESGVGRVSDPPLEHERAGPRPAILQSRRPIFVGVIACIVAALAVCGYFWVRRPAESARHPTQNAGAGTRPPTALLSEARKLVAQARLQLDKPEMARIELDTAEGFCKRAAELDDRDAEVWAAWSQVNTWFVYYNFDSSLARREAARDYAARAMQLAPRSFEARLAQACYWMRGEGLDVAFVEDKNPLYLVEAERLLRELHAEQPDEPRTLLMLGFLRVWKDIALPERYDLLERATKNPAFAAEAWKEIGWVKFFQGDPVTAVAAAERSIAVQPTWNNLWLKALLATVWLGDRDLAKATLDRMPVAALQEDVGLVLTYWVYAWRNEPLVALGLLERQPREWLRMSGYIGPKALLTGKLRRMANQPELARRDFLRARELVEKALVAEPNNRNLFSLKAQTLHFLGEPEEARRTYRLGRDLGGNLGPETEALFNAPELTFDEANRYIDSLQGRPNTAWFFTAAAWRLAPEYAELRKHPRYSALQSRLDADPRFSPNAKAAKPTNAASDPKSVAVLPFANQSDDKANESFSDGISEELGVVLGKVPGLRVAGWNSALSFKGKNVPEAEIARKLGVTHIVSGSVQKSGTQVRITARLVNAADGFSLWSDSFRREAKDIFAVQDEIAGLIAQNLKLQLGVDARRSRAVNPEAHRLVLEGRHFWNQRNNDGFARAEVAFLKAIEIDPTFAEAHTGLAGVYVVRGTYQTLEDSAREIAEDFRRARIAATKAVELGPDLAEAHAVLGYTLFNQGERNAAEREFEKALALNPNSAATFTWSGLTASVSGRLDTALASYAKAAALDPLWFINLHMYAEGLYYAARYEEALRIAERAAALRSDTFIPNLGLRAQILFALDRRAEASAMARTIRTQLQLDTRWTADAQAIFVLRQCGEVKEAAEYAVEALRQLEAASPTRAHIFAASGDLDKALPTIGGTRMTMRRYLLWDPIWDPWRDDPRFLAALAQLGCAEDYKVARETLARLKLESTAKK